MSEINIGGGLASILTIIFVIAKLWGVIDWSWWLVFLPILIGISIFLGIILVLFLIVVIGELIK